MNVLTLPGARAVAPWISKWLHDNLATRRSQLLLALLAFTFAAAGLTVLDSIDTGMRRTLAERQGPPRVVARLAGSTTMSQDRTETELSRAHARIRHCVT